MVEPNHIDEARIRTVRHEIAPRSLFTILAIIGGILLVARIWQTILILVVALVLAGTFSPVVTWLERRRIPRAAALALVLVALLAAVVGLGALIHPAFARQFAALSADAPRIQARLADFAARVPPLAGCAAAIRSAQPGRLLTPVGAFALKSAGTPPQLVVVGFTTVVIAFYLIADHERVQGFPFAFLPRRYHVRTARVLLDMETVVGGYMRGQALTSLCIGVFAYALLSFLGVPAALPLAVLAAFADLIPLVGGVSATAPSVLFAQTVGPVQAVIVLVAFRDLPADGEQSARPTHLRQKPAPFAHRGDGGDPLVGGQFPARHYRRPARAADGGGHSRADRELPDRIARRSAG